jgi:rhamnulokinase
VRILAVDLGASSGRTIVGEVEGGRIALTETHRFENGMVETDGSKRWDVDALLAEIKTGIAASGALDGIGIDTWGVDYGLLDADGNLLDAPYAYRDARHETAIPEVYARVPKDQLYARTGMQELPFNTVFQLVAEGRERPDLHERARRMLLMPELLTYLLTGQMQSEYSISSTTGLLNAQTRDWDRALLRKLGLPDRLFGPIAMPGARAGACEGTPVFCPAMHDTGSAVAAVPAVEGGEWAYLSSGTWSLIGAELAEPVLTPEAA